MFFTVDIEDSTKHLERVLRKENVQKSEIFDVVSSWNLDERTLLTREFHRICQYHELSHKLPKVFLRVAEFELIQLVEERANHDIFIGYDGDLNRQVLVYVFPELNTAEWVHVVAANDEVTSPDFATVVGQGVCSRNEIAYVAFEWEGDVISEDCSDQTLLMIARAVSFAKINRLELEHNLDFFRVDADGTPSTVPFKYGKGMQLNSFENIFLINKSRLGRKISSIAAKEDAEFLYEFAVKKLRPKSNALNYVAACLASVVLFSLLLWSLGGEKPEIVRVKIECDSPNCELHIFPLDKKNQPILEQALVRNSPAELDLAVGDYFITAIDKKGNWNEVTRRVPRSDAELMLETPLRFEREGKTVILAKIPLGEFDTELMQKSKLVYYQSVTQDANYYRALAGFEKLGLRIPTIEELKAISLDGCEVSSTSLGSSINYPEFGEALMLLSVDGIENDRFSYSNRFRGVRSLQPRLVD